MLGLKDSGERTEFKTGAVRDISSGKGLPSLVPNWVIWLASRIYEDGAKKYSSRNWEKGMNLSRYLDSLERHLAKLKTGMRDEPHASQILWNIIGYIYTAGQIKMGNKPEYLNDMPDQLSDVSGKIAEPLSPYEYESLKTFFGEFPKEKQKITFQYVAGLFDGEGSISIIRREKKRKEAYSLRMNIYSTNKKVLQDIKKELGGFISERDRGNKKHAIGYCLTWNHRAAGDMIDKIFPFLIIKNGQAELAIKFQSIVSKNQKFGRKGLSAEIIKELREMKKQINFLNRKGRK